MARHSSLKLLAVVGLAAAFGLAQAQQAFNVSLYKNFTLAQMTASAGNDCWGYVSPSGREYAIASENNKIVFVEVTDPANATIIATIPHNSSTWGDVKVYGSTAYAVTETSGTGIQVVDMSNIDAATNRVTLVRTITSPGRTHNLALDTVSGFLYTCGSHEGTGTTMCFDLKPNPLNPVQVGMASLTSTYQHDICPITYTSGPYAGKQILFGNGEGRGIEIWDATDKNNVTLIRRVAYPFVAYCHQGWIDAARHYWYVDDELDEQGGSVPTTRTLVFDISVLETTDLVGTYTTGLPTIDHNLYWRNGFVFQSDYSSGLRIFNTNVDPINPPQVGWYDTFPTDDRKDYVGAWSSYAFFPSGTVVTNDINNGFFVLDVSQATKTDFACDNWLNVRGRVLGGGLPELATIDQQYLVVGKGLTANQNEAPIQQVFEGTCLWTDISKLQFSITNKVNTAGLQQTVELYDWNSNTWVQATTGAAPTTDTTTTVLGPSPDRFVNPVTKKMKARLSVQPGGIVSNNTWTTSIDQVKWTVNP